MPMTLATFWSRTKVFSLRGKIDVVDAFAVLVVPVVVTISPGGDTRIVKPPDARVKVVSETFYQTHIRSDYNSNLLG